MANQQHQGPKTVLVSVHGTFAARDTIEGSDWWQTEGRFCSDVLSCLPAEAVAGRCPFSWSGENSEKERRMHGQVLLNTLREFDEKGVKYHLAAHSHGGGVIWHALTRSVHKNGKPLEGLLSWTTMGTPFMVLKADRFPAWTLLPLVIAALGLPAFSAGVGHYVEVSGELVGAGQWIDLLAFPLLVLIGLVILFSCLRSLAVWGIAVRLNASEGKAVTVARDTYGGRWLGIWSEQDEAINAISATIGLRGKIAPRMQSGAKSVIGRIVALVTWPIRVLYNAFLAPLLDTLLWSIVAKKAQGLEFEGTVVSEVRRVPWQSEARVSLDEESESSLRERADQGATTTVRGLRGLLGKIALGAGTVEDISKAFSDEGVTLQGLVHTTYYEDPLVVQRVGRHMTEPVYELAVPAKEAGLPPRAASPNWLRWSLGIGLLAGLLALGTASSAYRLDRSALEPLTARYQIDQMVSDAAAITSDGATYGGGVQASTTNLAGVFLAELIRRGEEEPIDVFIENLRAAEGEEATTRLRATVVAEASRMLWDSKSNAAEHIEAARSLLLRIAPTEPKWEYFVGGPHTVLAQAIAVTHGIKAADTFMQKHVPAERLDKARVVAALGLLSARRNGESKALAALVDATTPSIPESEQMYFAQGLAEIGRVADAQKILQRLFDASGGKPDSGLHGLELLIFAERIRSGEKFDVLAAEQEIQKRYGTAADPNPSLGPDSWSMEDTYLERIAQACADKGLFDEARFFAKRTVNDWREANALAYCVHPMAADPTHPIQETAKEAIEALARARRTGRSARQEEEVLYMAFRGIARDDEVRPVSSFHTLLKDCGLALDVAAIKAMVRHFEEDTTSQAQHLGDIEQMLDRQANGVWSDAHLSQQGYVLLLDAQVLDKTAMSRLRAKITDQVLAACADVILARWKSLPDTKRLYHAIGVLDWAKTDDMFGVERDEIPRLVAELGRLREARLRALAIDPQRRLLAYQAILQQARLGG